MLILFNVCKLFLLLLLMLRVTIKQIIFLIFLLGVFFGDFINLKKKIIILKNKFVVFIKQSRKKGI